ncbi:phosphotransferase [Nocardia sp. NBC_00508]|uniref:phosphotransferase n=1 Tax=Nocardia sp. NBC_00508 TaxID=2975992 RepID=UPI002E80B460|nr:phosphotransferase [Nocardia sp. NBC_00508]WUD68435.1 phosphotransferase [Nocardia sp. NBC_00508]
MPETPLRGGFINDVVRIGDTVRRRPSARAEFVHELLGRFEQSSWTGAPRFVGMDEQGREILTYLDGYVAFDQERSAPIASRAALARIAELIRAFHDVTAGTDLAADAEVVCHNDLSPKNTVYRDLGDGMQPVAFLDWDLAAPGRRIHDLAHACWQYLYLGPGITDAATAAEPLRLMCDAYGTTERSELLDTILWWQDRCQRGIEIAAAAGEPAMVRLRSDGVPARIRAAHRWVTEHRTELGAALS